MPGTQLTEAILNAQGASALIQKVIDPAVFELERRYSPLVALIPRERIGEDVYHFDQVSQYPAGGFVTDGGSKPISNSTYTQDPSGNGGFQIKHMLIVGGVTGYANAVTSTFGDLLGREKMYAVRGLTQDIETALVWGNSAATAGGPYPQFDGLASLVNSNAAGAPNLITPGIIGGSSTFSLGVLDYMMDMVEIPAASWPDGQYNGYFFLMSERADNMLGQLVFNQQRFVSEPNSAANFGKIEVIPGLIVPSYRNVPIMKSSYLNSRAIAMSTVATTPSSTGGSLAAATYYYQIEAIIARWGCTLASTEVSQTVSGSTSTITLSFTPPVVTSVQQNLGAIGYRVYRSTSTGTETLLGWVDSAVALQPDGVTPIFATSIVDTGATLIPQAGSVVPLSWPAAYPGTNPYLTPRQQSGAGNFSGAEDMFLAPADPEVMKRLYVREMQQLDLYPTTAAPDALPYANVCDTTLGLRAPNFVSRASGFNVQLTH